MSSSTQRNQIKYKYSSKGNITSTLYANAGKNNSCVVHKTIIPTIKMASTDIYWFSLYFHTTGIMNFKQITIIYFIPVYFAQ
jgi:hypothetical protein